MDLLGREKNKAVYQHDEIVTDMATGEIISATTKTITKIPKALILLNLLDF